MSATIWESEGFEDSGFSLMGYVLGGDAAAIQQADISSIAYTVTDLSDDSEVGADALTVSSVVFDSLQTDARWSLDSTGYNFRWDVPASLVPTGGRTYRIEVKFTPASGEAFHIVHERSAADLKRS